MKLKVLFTLFVLSAIAKGQWAAAARGLYQPIALSVGTVFTAVYSQSSREYGENYDDRGNWLGSLYSTIKDKFYKKPEAKPKVNKEDLDTRKVRSELTQDELDKIYKGDWLREF